MAATATFFPYTVPSGPHRVFEVGGTVSLFTEWETEAQRGGSGWPLFIAPAPGPRESPSPRCRRLLLLCMPAGIFTRSQGRRGVRPSGSRRCSGPRPCGCHRAWKRPQWPRLLLCSPVWQPAEDFSPDFLEPDSVG